MRFFEKSFLASVVIPCVFCVMLFILQTSFNFYFPFLPVLSENTLMASMAQGALLALILPWFFFARYEEFWLTRSLLRQEFTPKIWHGYLRWWVGLVLVFATLPVFLNRLLPAVAGIEPVGSYWLIVFASLSFYGALLFVQGLKPDLKQAVIGGGVLIGSLAIALQFPQWHQTVIAGGLCVLCGLSWGVWRFATVKDSVAKAHADFSVFLFAPLGQRRRWKNPLLNRYWTLGQESYYALLLLILLALPLLVLLTWPFFLRSWDEVMAITGDLTLPLSPWLTTAIFLLQIPVSRLWKSREEFWLTRPVSFREMHGVNLFVQGILYLALIAQGMVVCQLFSGYSFAFPFYLLVLYLFLLGPVTLPVFFLSIVLGYGQSLSDLSWLLIKGDTITFALWILALGWMLYRLFSTQALRRFYLPAWAVTSMVLTLLFIWGSQHTAVLRVTAPIDGVPIYRQQWRMGYQLTNVLWFNVPVQEEPFAIANALKHLDDAPVPAVRYLLKDTLNTLNKNQDIYEMQTYDFRSLWEGDRERTLQALNYWSAFAPEVQDYQPFALALGNTSEQAIQRAEQLFKQDPTLEKGLQLAFLQRVYFFETQALSTYADLRSRYPEAQVEIYRYQGDLWSEARDFQQAEIAYQHGLSQARQSGESLPLKTLKALLLSQRVNQLPVGSLKMSLTDYRQKREYQRLLNGWLQYSTEQRLNHAQRFLFDANNDAQVLSLFLPRLSTANAVRLQQLHFEIKQFVSEAQRDGLIYNARRPLHAFLTQLWKQKGVKKDLSQRYPELAQLTARMY